MGIGHLVFHALNATEIGLASVILVVTLKANCSRHRRRVTVLTGLMLATQSVLLYTVMDARTLDIINRPAPQAPPVTQSTSPWRLSSCFSCST